MAERPDMNDDDALFNYQPLQWLLKHQNKPEDPLNFLERGLYSFVNRAGPDYILLQGSGVAVYLHANGTWTLEDTTGG